MKILTWLGCLSLAVCTVLPAREESPPLPSMNDTTRKNLEKSAWVPGELLLAEDPENSQLPPPPPGPMPGQPPSTDDLTDKPTTTIPVPEKFLAAYFAARPKEFLVDPQKLLDQQAANDQLKFLKNHAADSAIDLFLYVFNHDQEIPGDVRDEELGERFFADGRPAMIAFFFIGAPQQAALYLSPALTDHVPAPEQRRMLQSAIALAIGKNNPREQLEVFTNQLASRSYWIERLLEGRPIGADPRKLAQTRAAKQAKKPSPLADKLAVVRTTAMTYVLPGSLALATMFTAFALILWLRWRATYQFPSCPVEPRLGGNHAAGIGTIISFSHTAPPPAQQRNQAPEYRHRI